jgi:hypothetical protein
MWSLIYQIEFSATRSVSIQMKGSYKTSCSNSIFKYDKICQFKFNTKSMIPMIFRCFLQNTYSHITEHWCSAEHGLGMAVLQCLNTNCHAVAATQNLQLQYSSLIRTLLFRLCDRSKDMHHSISERLAVLYVQHSCHPMSKR